MAETREEERLRWYAKRFFEGEGIDAARVRGGSSGSSVVAEDAAGATTEIRVVELLRPPEGGDRESVRAFRRSLAREAERRWGGDDNRPNVEVWVEFSGHEQTTAARDRTGLAGTLCALVEGALPDPDGFARIVPEDPGGTGNFPLTVSGLTVARLREYTGSSWHVAGSAPAKEVDPDVVRAAVRRASTGAGERRRPGAGGSGSGSKEEGRESGPGRRWLLLVVDSFRLTGEPALPDEVTAEEYGSAFDRIVLFDPVRAETTELGTGKRDRGG